MNQHRPWDEDDLWVIHHLRDTLNAKQMSILLGRSHRAVLAMAEQLELKFGRGRPRLYDDEECLQLLLMRQEGMSERLISHKTGIPKSTVHRILNEIRQ